MTAVERFGRLDILVNNAGIIRWAGFPDADSDNLSRHLAVHTVGSFNTTRAAWPHMVEQGYGRIVMTTSSGIFGLPKNLSYATAKAAVIGLTRSLTTAGAAHGIKVNLIAPAAFTRMAGQPADEADSPGRGAAPSPMSSGSRRTDGRLPCPRGLPRQRRDLRGRRWSVRPHLHRLDTPGTSTPTPEPTIEDVAENWATINDETGYYVPADLTAWSAAFMAHLPPRVQDLPPHNVDLSLNEIGTGPRRPLPRLRAAGDRTSCAAGLGGGALPDRSAPRDG